MFHPITRALAAVTCLPCIVLAVIGFYWQELPAGGMYALSAFVLGKIAATGEVSKRARLREELYRLAIKYKSGEITLEEFGNTTKSIVGA